MWHHYAVWRDVPSDSLQMQNGRVLQEHFYSLPFTVVLVYISRCSEVVRRSEYQPRHQQKHLVLFESKGVAPQNNPQ